MTPEPGIYEGVDFATYCAWDAMNASTLVHGMSSMRQLKWKLDGKLPQEDTDAMRFGRAVHCRLLEPDQYPTRFPMPERCCANLKPARKGAEPKRCTSGGRYMGPEGWYCGTHAPEDAYQPPDFVTPEEAERVEQIRKSAMGDRDSGELGHKEIREIRRFKGAEVSLVFEVDGVLCKCRTDKLIREGGGFVIDPKCIQNRRFDEHGFETDIRERHYHVKAAMNLLGVKALLGLDAQFWWVFCQTHAPFDVAAVRLSDFDRSVGIHEVRRLLDSFKRCKESGVWPGAFPDLVEHVGLPSWVARQYASTELGE